MEKAFQDEMRKLMDVGNLRVIKRESWMKPIPFLEVLTIKNDPLSGEIIHKVSLTARGDLIDDP